MATYNIKDILGFESDRERSKRLLEEGTNLALLSARGAGPAAASLLNAPTAIQNVQEGLNLFAGREPKKTTTQLLAEQLAQLDPTKKDDQAKIIQLVSKVNPAGAMDLMGTFSEANLERQSKESDLEYKKALTRQAIQGIKTPEQLASEEELRRLQIENIGSQIEQRELDRIRQEEADEWTRSYRDAQLNLENERMANLQQERDDRRAERKLQSDLLTASERDRYYELEEELDVQIGQANKAISLAERYERLRPSAGYIGTAKSQMKDIFGRQDGYEILKRDFEDLKTQYALLKLPPGPASDKDIQFALSSFLPSNANPDAVAQFLRGQAKMAALVAAQADLKLEYLQNNYETPAKRGTILGWREEWNAIREDEERLVDYMQEAFGNTGITNLMYENSSIEVSEDEFNRTVGG